MNHLRLVPGDTVANTPEDAFFVALDNAETRVRRCYRVTATVDAGFPANGRLTKDVWHNIPADNAGAAMLHVLAEYVGNGLGNTIHKMTVEEARGVAKIDRR